MADILAPHPIGFARARLSSSPLERGEVEMIHG